MSRGQRVKVNVTIRKMLRLKLVTLSVCYAFTGSGTGPTSGSGSATTGSGTVSGAETLASSMSKIHLKKPRNEPVRKIGDAGKPCPMQTNYIKIHTETSNIYQYHVYFEPHVDARNIRFSMMRQNKDALGPVMAFDGVILYLPIKLEDPVTMLTGLRKTDNATINIRVSPIRKLVKFSREIGFAFLQFRLSLIAKT